MASRIFKSLLLTLCLALFSTLAWPTETIYPFASPRQEAQFNYLLRELRCLVCQNQDLADSHAGLAVDLRQQVYESVLAGKSDQEIIDFLTARYGDFILFKPPVKPVTALLWFGPLLFLLLGLFIFWSACLKKKSYV